jgi:hypothetical protein
MVTGAAAIPDFPRAIGSPLRIRAHPRNPRRYVRIFRGFRG